MLLELSMTNTNRSPFERAPKNTAAPSSPPGLPLPGLPAPAIKVPRSLGRASSWPMSPSALVPAPSCAGSKFAHQAVGDVELLAHGEGVLQLGILKLRGLDLDLADRLGDVVLRLHRAGKQRNALLHERDERERHTEQQRDRMHCEAAHKWRRVLAIGRDSAACALE